jgi:hypothetical protein
MTGGRGEKEMDRTGNIGGQNSRGNGRADGGNSGRMSDRNSEKSSGGEGASTSFCWTYGGKEGREVFDLETTISGTLNEADIENHIASAIRAMGAVFRHGGRAGRRIRN